MTSSRKERFRSYRPLRSRIERHAAALSQAGFRILAGSDAGWFGDGEYILGNGTQQLRITRSRGEEFVEVAFSNDPAEAQWSGLADLMVVFDVVSFDDAVAKHVIPHDLDFKIDAYCKLYPTIEKELAQDRAGLERRISDVRKRGIKYVQDEYGKARS